jgi:hypothetical protein
MKDPWQARGLSDFGADPDFAVVPLILGADW